MKHLALARMLLWLLIAVCPPLFHCGGNVEHGTETGNPPVVEQQKLHIVLRENGVEVVGDPGAVSPGASVSVTNRRTGERVEATAGTDGSVTVIVPGLLQDEYEVTVSNGSGSQTVRVAADTSAATGGAGGGGSDLASASCTTLEQTLQQSVTATYTNASKSCQADRDCTTAGDVGCYYSCGGPIVSTSGKRTAEAAILQDTTPLCAELSQRCGPRGAPGCPYQMPTTLGCNDGTCQPLGCEDLGRRAAARVDEALSNAPRDCTVDTDCSLISSAVRCVADCGSFRHSVATSAVAQLNQVVLLTQDPLCSEFESRSCPPPRPLPCEPAATPNAVCIGGQCDVQYPLP
jgi:hypothetical protein